jgi:hypothetical protein
MQNIPAKSFFPGQKPLVKKDCQCACFYTLAGKIPKFYASIINSN